MVSRSRTFKPPYLVKRTDNSDLLEGPFDTRLRAETRADALAKSLRLDLFVHSKNAYGKWRVYRSGGNWTFRLRTSGHLVSVPGTSDGLPAIKPSK
jgi:hypothetical protein